MSEYSQHKGGTLVVRVPPLWVAAQSYCGCRGNRRWLLLAARELQCHAVKNLTRELWVNSMLSGECIQ